MSDLVVADRVLPERLVEVYLTPVQVFGTEDGYGLCDATSAWSDCNRAIGHIFRVDDLEDTGNPERVRIRVLVAESDLEKLRANYDTDPETADNGG